MTECVIDVRNVDKAYGEGVNRTPVLRSVELQVQRGQCVFLAGPSGSGKSTLLSILGCLLTPDAGRVHILGQDVTRCDARQQAQFRRERIGFVFQRFHLFRGLNAWENVRVALDLLGYSRRRSREEVPRLLHAVGLGHKMRSDIRQLSMGQCQRVAMARALAGDPDLIFADEPTASLDAESGKTVMELLRALTTDTGKTAVVVTHDHRIFSYADRVFNMVNGQIVETGVVPDPAEHA